MPAPLASRTTVIACKGCTRAIPAAASANEAVIRVRCPICLEHRSYRVATEVYLGHPHWEIMRVLQGRRHGS